MLLQALLNTIVNPRCGVGRHFDLPHLLLFAIQAILFGFLPCITRFMQVRLPWFESLPGVRWSAAPCHTGLRKCFFKLDGNAI